MSFSDLRKILLMLLLRDKLLMGQTQFEIIVYTVILQICSDLIFCGSNLLRRWTPFEDLRENERFTGHVINTLKTSSQSACVLVCNREEDCLSINFCNAEFCQLNSADVFSTTHGASLLKYDPYCRYAVTRGITYGYNLCLLKFLKAFEE